MSEIILLDDDDAPAGYDSSEVETSPRSGAKLVAVLLVAGVLVVAVSVVRNLLSDEAAPSEAILLDRLNPTLLVRAADATIRTLELEGQPVPFGQTGRSLHHFGDGWLVALQDGGVVEVVNVADEPDAAPEVVHRSGAGATVDIVGSLLFEQSRDDAVVVDFDGNVVFERSVEGRASLTAEGRFVSDSSSGGEVIIWEVASGERVVDTTFTRPGETDPIGRFGSLLWLEDAADGSTRLRHRDPQGQVRTVLDGVETLTAIHAGPRTVVVWPDVGFGPPLDRAIDPVQVWTTDGGLVDLDLPVEGSVSFIDEPDHITVAHLDGRRARLTAVSRSGVISPPVDVELALDAASLVATRLGQIVYAGGFEDGNVMAGFINVAADGSTATLNSVDLEPIGVVGDVLLLGDFVVEQQPGETGGPLMDLTILQPGGEPRLVANDVNLGFIVGSGSGVYFNRSGEQGVYRVDLSGGPPELVAAEGLPLEQGVTDAIRFPRALVTFDFSRLGG